MQQTSETRQEYRQAFKAFFGSDPTPWALKVMNQTRINTKVGQLHHECVRYQQELDRLNAPYKEANAASIWEDPKLTLNDYYRAQWLGRSLTKIGQQIAKADILASMFGFAVPDASKYGYSGERLSIHNEVDKIVGETQQ